jgi:hypothetical protein
MSYILDQGLSSGVAFLLERIRNGSCWAILRMDPKVSVPDIIYINQKNGYSLMPPKVGWESSHKNHSPGPNVTWIMEGDEMEQDDQDDQSWDSSSEQSDIINDDAQVASPDSPKSQNSHGRKMRVSLSAKALRRGTMIQNQFRNAIMVTDSGSLAVQARYEEHGASDGVPAYCSNRDPAIHLRRVEHGKAKLWVVVRISNVEGEPNFIYYYNATHGGSDVPKSEGWECYSGDEPAPLVIFQEGLIKN